MNKDKNFRNELNMETQNYVYIYFNCEFVKKI